MLAALKLNGLFEKAEGIILGDFHDKDTNLRDAVFSALKYHLPAKRRIPVIQLDTFGHIWPLAPLPMHRELTLRCNGNHRPGSPVHLDIPWSDWI